MPFKSLGVVSYSPSIATMAISCIVCEIATYCAIFLPHLYLTPPHGVTMSEFREDLGIHKTRMNELSCGGESMTIYSAVLIQYQRVTDGRTDGQTDRRTDVQPISITCFSIADACKNITSVSPGLRLLLPIVVSIVVG